MGTAGLTMSNESLAPLGDLVAGDTRAADALDGNPGSNVGKMGRYF